MQHLDKGLEPPDREPENNTEEILAWVIKKYTPAQLFGEDVFEKFAIDFVRWLVKDYCPNKSFLWFRLDSTRETVRFLKIEELYEIYISGEDYFSFIAKKQQRLNYIFNNNTQTKDY